MRRVRYISTLMFVMIGVLAMCNPVQVPESTPSPTKYANLPQEPTIFRVQIDAPASEERLSDPRPNFIVVITDDQPYHTIDFMPTVKSELIEKGVNFERGYVTTPLCCPSRASILTGDYVYHHQVYTNRMPLGGASKFDDSSTIAVWLNQSGYRTAFYGKYMNAYHDLSPYGRVATGWDDWGVFLSRDEFNYFFNYTMSINGQEVEYPKSKANFSADVLTKMAIKFISEARDEPFFLFVSYFNPHSPYMCAPRHRGAFKTNSGYEWVPHRSPSINEEDISDKPAYIGELSPLSTETLDIGHRQILRSLLSVDDGVASILNTLQEAGLSENTIIVFLSDNGLTVGDHRFGLSKNCPYEECIRVPFIIYAPGYFAPRRETSLVANIDLAPTFAELAGITIPDPIDGTSLVPLLSNPTITWREELLFEHWPTEEGVGSMIPEFVEIRTESWKYIEYTTGEYELYDLRNDPYELNNLASLPDYTLIKSELAKRLQELRKD